MVAARTAGGRVSSSNPRSRRRRPSHNKRTSTLTIRTSLVAAVGGSLLLSLGAGAYLWMLYRSVNILQTTTATTTAAVDNDNGAEEEPKLISAAPKTQRFEEQQQDGAPVGSFRLLESSSSSSSSRNTTTTPLPQWMTDYFAWHAQQLQTLTADNWRTNHKFLVARCLEVDRACGGISDRLKSLPTLLLLAAQSRRVLLLEWSRPAPLQAFLVPHTASGGGGINWTRPSFVPARGLGTRLYTKLPALIRATTTAGAANGSSTVPVLCARLQEQHGGSDYYNRHPWNDNDNSNKDGTKSSSEQLRPRRAFRGVFRRLFFAVFAPAPGVREQYQREARQLRRAIMTSHNSTKGVGGGSRHHPNLHFNAAHLRAYYGNHPVPEAKVAAVAINAVNCASHLSTQQTAEKDDDDPILFISDSILALQAVERHAQNWDLPIFTTLPYRRHDRRAMVAKEPLHLDKAASREADDYNDIFVDLLHFARARCVSHGQGGFGRLGALLSRDPACFHKYIDQALYVECRWKKRSSGND